jgi:methionine-rich copper-binding protein CopC
VNHMKTTFLFLLMSVLAACGSQIVEFPTDVANADGTSADGSLDSSGDSGSDAKADVGPDAVDAGTDASADAVDAGTDAGPEDIADAGTDAGPEDTADVGTDAGPEDTADVGTDAGPDVLADVDAGPGDAIDAGTDVVTTAPTVTATSPGKDATKVSVGTAITVTFSQAMDNTTITSQTFQVKQGDVVVTGTLTFGPGNTATFTPTDPLEGDSPFTVTLGTGIHDAGGTALASAFAWSFTTGATPDTTAPIVTSTSPVADSKDIAVNTKITVMFSEAMDPLTINGTTITVKFGNTVVAGTVTYGTGNTATFTPTSALPGNTLVTVSVSTGVKDPSGNALATVFNSKFTTGATPDTTAPTVSATSPSANTTGVGVNTKITVTFSEAMDPLTILSGVSFNVKQGGTAVPGTLAYGPGNTVTFTPSTPLPGNLVYTVTLTTGVQDLAGNPLDLPYTFAFTTGTAPDTTAPVVSSTSPAANSTGVAVNTKVTVTFSEAMDPLSITTSTFTVKQNGVVVQGTLAYGPGHTVTFTPSSPLGANLTFTATVTSAVKDLAGNPMGTFFTWTFATGAAPDTTAPTVLSVSPGTSSTGAAVNTKVTVTFSEPMDPLSLTTATVTVKQGNVLVTGTVAYGPGNTVTFTPNSPLAANTPFTITVTGAKDLAGNALTAVFTSGFTTGAAPDTTAPTVTAVHPAADATQVSVATDVTATFSEAMDPLTITTVTFTLKQGTTAVQGTVSYGLNNTAKFVPANPLGGNTMYTATLGTGVKDLAGNPLAQPFTWSFMTAPLPAKGPAPVLLGTAGNYVVLAKTAISTVPASAITGDIAVSPAAASFITGFSLVADSTNVFSTSPQVVGKVFAANYAVPTPANLTTAIANMETAYTDAAGRPTPDFLELGTGNIGGKTLVPGLYKWTSTITIPADVVLNGGANDVWIFQTSGDIIQSANKNVTLTGGAQAKNVFWQVAGHVVVGSGAHFEGVMLVKTDVTLQTGASITGRILAQTQAALQKATVTHP